MKDLFILLILFTYSQVNADSQQQDMAPQIPRLQCSTYPVNNDKHNVIASGDMFSFKCTLHSHNKLQTATWTHNISMHQPGQPDDITCTSTSIEGGRYCADDARILHSLSSGGTIFGISVSRSRPDDTGKWSLMAVDQAGYVLKEQFEIFTYNRSTISILDNNREGSDVTRDHVHAIYNHKRCQVPEEVQCSTTVHRAKFQCNSEGGRPGSQIKWTINDIDQDLSKDHNFTIADLGEVCLGEGQYLCSNRSTIEFDIDDVLMDRLKNFYNIEVNEYLTSVDFDLNCVAVQEKVKNRAWVELKIQRKYFSYIPNSSSVLGGYQFETILALLLITNIFAV